MLNKILHVKLCVTDSSPGLPEVFAFFEKRVDNLFCLLLCSCVLRLIFEDTL